ncbi:HNH endonuclease signature motif containing protein [Myceligenerans xiligouense]|uniref:Uncharacterized protein DUF222 n=1 Tax=Myceligenerans xiligouense TaxID=253184 RepID=A0A3N4Z733_9MICO|nr:HNH endonuclease signature motif containing protein [Myceligenerans xiligouense]RPF21638.1 uncharacterized protein DUF222 [Myceligenerans xiligouense]
MPENRRVSAGGARPVGELLAELEALATEIVATVGPEALRGDPALADSAGVTALVDASARLRRVGHRFDVLRATFLPLIDDAGLWALTGARTFATWLAAAEGVSRSTARRETRTATVLRDVLPVARKAALDGTIGPEHLRALVDVAPTSQARKDALAAPAIDAPFEDGRDGLQDKGYEGGRQAGLSDAVGDAGEGANGDGGPRVPTWEDQLLEWAGERQAEDFRGLVRYFAHRADPDADERGMKKARDKEYLNVSPTIDGFHVTGFLTPEHGDLVTTALGSVTGAPAAEDDRTPGQRRAQGLADLARTALDNGHIGTGAAVRPHLNVTVSWAELRGLAHHTDRPAGDADHTLLGALMPVQAHTGARPGGSATTPSWVAGQTRSPHSDPPAPASTPAVITGTGTCVPASLLRRITCDCEVTRIVFGPDGAVLDVGRAQRTVTGPMRRAVIARDKHCVWPGCDQPPSRCEVHHAVRHWADGGGTSVDNAALLCWHHHDRVDGQGITMRWTGNTAGARHSGWTLTDRNGREITLASTARGARSPARPPATSARAAPPRATSIHPPETSLAA